jgi:thiamine biosynthesis lipoprotein
MQRYAFRAMGTHVECFVEIDEDSGDAFASVEAEFERLEAALSRFRLDSELSRLNREGRLEASPELFEVTLLALEARRRTQGRFDPTIHDAVVAAGYDRSFEHIDETKIASSSSSPCGGDVHVDVDTSTIELGLDTRLDFGGIGKGYAVDRACKLLGAFGPCLVSAGGDLAVRGKPVLGTWPIGVETPDGAISLALDKGALATSGQDRRRWNRGGREQHHLIDPATGKPADSEFVRVSVAATCAVEAEVLAKALFLVDEESAVREADSLGAPAILVTVDGRTVLAGGLE